jgi:hypothetical protein
VNEPDHTSGDSAPWGPPIAPGTAVPPTAAPMPEPEHVVLIDGPVRRRPGRFVAAGAAALLVGGAAFAATNLRSASGGFETPEAAVRGMVAAFDQEDALGVIDALRPGEREAMRGLVLPVFDELMRLDVLAGADLNAISGVDIAVEGLEVSTEELHDRLAVVNITGGTITSSTNPGELPLGSVLRDLVDGASPTEPTTSPIATEGGTDDFLATVQEGGRWYVSLGFTVAEQARRAAGLPVPDPAAGIEATGADSPEAAVLGFLRAAGSLDARGAIGLLAPGEFGALQAYAPLFIDDLDAAAGEVGGDGPLVQVEADGPIVTGDGNRRVVRFEQASFEVPGSGRVVLEGGGCIEIAVEGEEPDRQCPQDDLGAVFDSEEFGSLDVDVPADVRAVLERVSEVRIGISAVREDGRWYVSLLGTMGTTVASYLQALEPGDFDVLGEWFETVADQIAGSISDAIFGFSGDPFADDPFADSDGFEDGSEDGFEDSGEQGTDEEDPAFACMSGYYDGLFEMTTEEYRARAQETRDCLLAVPDSEFWLESSPELKRPDCITVNPWSSEVSAEEFDDVFEALYACAEG